MKGILYFFHCSMTVVMNVHHLQPMLTKVATLSCMLAPPVVIDLTIASSRLVVNGILLSKHYYDNVELLISTLEMSIKMCD